MRLTYKRRERKRERALGEWGRERAGEMHINVIVYIM